MAKNIMLKTIYNEWTKFIGAKEWRYEYDNLLGKSTLNDLMEEFKKAGMPENPYDVPCETEEEKKEYPTFDKVFDMDTVCRHPIFQALYGESIYTYHGQKV